MPSFITRLVAGTAALGGASYAVSRQQAEIRAEPSPAPRFARPESVEHHRSSLPLYEKPSEPIELVPVKSPLQDEVAQARAFVQEATKGLRTTTDGGKQAWLDWERKAEGSVQRIVSPQDQLNPGAMYVAVATLAGSILGRNRNFLVRLALPPTLFFLSLSHFLPHTADNVQRRLEGLEAAHFPQVREAREKVSQAVKNVSSKAV